jgi:formylglycine-generating enzyme required for sulfatase activity
VSLSWDSAGSGVSYKVYYSNQNDPSGAKPLGNPTTGTSFNVNSMTSDMNYYFWVSSVKDGQESAKSQVVTVRTAAVPVNPATDDFVRINGGTFTMGRPGTEPGGPSYVYPQHQVTVSAFYMGKYEVTQKEYQALMGNNPSHFKGDNLPVEQVSWFDAAAYCNARSRKEGLSPAYTINGESVTWSRSANGYRLPTEAEWEYACRAGTTTPYYTGSSADAAGWHSGDKTHPVGQKQPNPWGLYDMSGNVSEWCWDWLSSSYPSGAQTDPIGASSGSHRVLRGGSWHYSDVSIRSDSKQGSVPSNRHNDTGFRLVRP